MTIIDYITSGFFFMVGAMLFIAIPIGAIMLMAWLANKGIMTGFFKFAAWAVGVGVLVSLLATLIVLIG